MINMSTDRLIRLSEMAGMLYQQRQEFKVGDVVESKNDIVSPEGSKGIVIFEFNEDSPPDYDVYWYGSEVGSVFREDLRHCEGLDEKELCIRCEYNDSCHHLDEIARCDISEFGEWRAEGKLYFYVCRQRKCRHLDVCLSEKWLPGSG